jgi:hypothetical protein
MDVSQHQVKRSPQYCARNLISTRRLWTRSWPFIASSTIIRRWWATPIALTTSVTYAIVVVGGFPHVDSRGGCMSKLGHTEIHTNPLANDFHAYTLLLGHFCILWALTAYKGKSPRPASLGINNNLYSLDRTIFGHDLIQLLFCGVNAESKYIQTLTWLRIVPAAYMSTPRGHWTVWMTPKELFPSVAICIALSKRAAWTGVWMRVTGLIKLWRPRTALWPVSATVRHPSWTGMTP